MALYDGKVTNPPTISVNYSKDEHVSQARPARPRVPCGHAGARTDNRAVSVSMTTLTVAPPQGDGRAIAMAKPALCSVIDICSGRPAQRDKRSTQQCENLFMFCQARQKRFKRFRICIPKRAASHCLGLKEAQSSEKRRKILSQRQSTNQESAVEKAGLQSGGNGSYRRHATTTKSNSASLHTTGIESRRLRRVDTLRVYASILYHQHGEDLARSPGPKEVPECVHALPKRPSRSI